MMDDDLSWYDQQVLGVESAHRRGRPDQIVDSGETAIDQTQRQFPRLLLQFGAAQKISGQTNLGVGFARSTSAAAPSGIVKPKGSQSRGILRVLRERQPASRFDDGLGGFGLLNMNQRGSLDRDSSGL